MIPPETKLRFINVLTGVVTEDKTYLPMWLVLSRLRQTPKVGFRDKNSAASFGHWCCEVHVVGDWVICRLCPAGLEDTLQHLHDLVGGVA